MDTIRLHAFSPDGKTIASGSDDKTIRLKDTRTGKIIKTHNLLHLPFGLVFFKDGHLVYSSKAGIHILSTAPSLDKETTLVAGKQDTWLSCRHDTQICLRHDNGTLLFKKDSQGRLHSIPPNDAGESSQLEILTSSDMIEIREGEDPAPVVVRVRNNGQWPVYWLRLYHEEAASLGTKLVFIPPVTHSRLGPGQEVTLTGQLLAVSSRESPQDKQTHTLKLALASAKGEPLFQIFKVVARTPQLEPQQQKADFDQKNNVVVMSWKNIGGATLTNPVFSAQLDNPQQDLGEVTPGSVAPDALARVSFILPEKDFSYTGSISITVRQPGLPLHIWHYPNLAIQFEMPPWLQAILVVVLFAVVWSLRLFTHPLVTAPSRVPDRLRAIPLESLQKARSLLRQAGRLKSILATLDLSDHRLERATRFATLPPRDRLSWLTELLTAQAESPLTPDQTHGVIRLGEQFPLNLPRLLLYSPQSTTPVEEVIHTFLQLPECRDIACLIVVVDPEQRRTLEQMLKDPNAMWVLPNSQEITALLLAPIPSEQFSHLLASRVKVSHISPYQTREGVIKESAFFGRKQILTDILTRTPRNYLVLGGRQLGKSSLLLELKRAYERRSGVICYYLSASHSDISQVLAMALGLPPTATMENILQTLAALPPGQNRIFLLDEMDSFVASDEQQEYRILHQFRNLSAEKKCHFIMAGFWGLARRAMDYHSPLRNFAETCYINALEPEACKELATKPMAYLDIQYENDALVTHLIEQTGQRANLIAMACNTLLENLEIHNRVITAQQVKTALDSLDIRNFLLSVWTNMNQDQKANALDRILVYLSAEQDEITLSGIRQKLLKVTPEEIKASLARLELAFVLNRQENRYRHQVPLLQNMLRAENLRELIAGELEQYYNS
ncbi:MAG: hypothetical protein HQL93_13770 [Magnetococcales bacterium]|nr:hypothetical protein [Magnetococcales bacterium]